MFERKRLKIDRVYLYLHVLQGIGKDTCVKVKSMVYLDNLQ